jgi:opacity protein-like surface antigen
MRRIGWGPLAYASVICAAHTAAAQSQWYIEGSAGTQLRMDAGRSTTFTNLNNGATAPGSSTVTFDPGFVGNLGLGYKFPIGIRVEAEVGYAHYSEASASPVSNGPALPFFNGNRLALQSGGGVDQGSATANAFYDLPISGGLIPYIGGGFGAVLTGMQGGMFTNSSSTVHLTQGGSSVVYPAILGEVGLNIVANAHWTVVPSYRFEHVFISGNAFPNDANIFKLGVRYSW